MAGSRVEQRALRLLSAFENAGKPVRSITIDGRKIQIVLASEEGLDDFDKIDMRHDKT